VTHLDDRYTPQSLISTCPGMVDTIEEATDTNSIKLLAGQVLENSLKAYLLNTGSTHGDLKTPDRMHDITALWKEAGARGLQPATIPDWADAIAAGHRRPYAARYRSENSGIYVPAQNELVRGLRALIDAVIVTLQPSKPAGKFALSGIGVAVCLAGNGTCTPPAP
jgi:hypothetical protein